MGRHYWPTCFSSKFENKLALIKTSRKPQTADCLLTISNIFLPMIHSPLTGWLPQHILSYVLIGLGVWCPNFNLNYWCATKLIKLKMQKL